MMMGIMMMTTYLLLHCLIRDLKPLDLVLEDTPVALSPIQVIL